MGKCHGRLGVLGYIMYVDLTDTLILLLPIGSSEEESACLDRHEEAE